MKSMKIISFVLCLLFCSGIVCFAGKGDVQGAMSDYTQEQILQIKENARNRQMETNGFSSQIKETIEKLKASMQHVNDNIAKFMKEMKAKKELLQQKMRDAKNKQADQIRKNKEVLRQNAQKQRETKQALEDARRRAKDQQQRLKDQLRQ